MRHTDLYQQQREIIRRLSAISLTDTTINHAVVADALEKFLRAIKRPVLPVKWAKDGRDACSLVAQAGYVTAIDGVKVNPATFREWFIRKQDNWRKTVDEVLEVAQNDVLQFVSKLLSGDPSDSNRAQVWDSSGNALLFAARAAAECLWAYEYHDTEERFRQYEIGDFEEDWFPFVDAYEGGLWLFWLTDAEVIALPRPIVHLKGQQVHSVDGPAVHWPEGAEEYFVVNGIQVPRELVEMPAADLDPRLVLRERDANVRHQVVLKIGLERLCDGLDAKCVDRQGDYELLMLDLQDEQAHPFLKMKDPSSGAYHVEGVAPECTTVAAALAWRNQTDVPPAVLK